MRQYPREILVKRHLGWRLRDTRTQKSLSREHLNRLIKMGKKVVVVDAQSKEYIARYDLHDVASKSAGQGKLSETARPITGSDAIILKRYFVQVFRETRTWKRVSRKHLTLLAEKGTKIIVVDTTTKEYKALLNASQAPPSRPIKRKPTKGSVRRLKIIEGHPQSPNILARWELIQPYLERRQRRAWAAAEAAVLGYGGDVLLSQITGMYIGTVDFWKRKLRKTKHAVAGSLAPTPHGIGGRSTEKIDAGVVPALERMLVDETAGDPMGHSTWARCSIRSLSTRLTAQGHPASEKIVRRLLRERGYTLRAVKKRRAGASCPHRDEQFQYIHDLKAHFIEKGLPVISIDAKKKEMIGDYYKPGKTWRKTPIEANAFFPSSRKCLAVPFGVFDVSRNTGYVTVGISANTPQFAINCVTSWWRLHGQTNYPNADRLLILADAGSSNNPKFKAWKMDLQDHLSDAFGLTITVSHYPPGCSKWNPIEHRLFGQISRNWAGRPLRSLAEMLAFIRGTTTTTGLKVEAELDQEVYSRGRKVTNQQLNTLVLTKHDVCPQWNYTLSPRPNTFVMAAPSDKASNFMIRAAGSDWSAI